MEFKHTPGPWGLDEFGSIVHGDNDGYGRKESVRVSGVMLPGRVTEEYAANTRLVSAAPELLDALQDALHAYDKHGEDPNWDFAREVIAKATGQ